MRNQYEIKESYGIVYATFKGEKVAFLFDLDVIEKMVGMDVMFSVNTSGYLYWAKRLPNKKRNTFTVHRYIVFNDVPNEYVVDHINRDIRDNRKKNLRLLTAKENNSRGYTSKHKNGKYYSWNYNRWDVRISYNGEQIRFGTFEKEEDAEQFARLLFKIWE